ncbi:MAG: flagellar basal body rod protein FlgC [Myxococcota bacterium]
MNLGDIVDIGVSGLVAQRARLAATASNLANAETTRTAEGGPYRRRDPVFSARALDPFGDRLEKRVRQVEVDRIVADTRPPTRKLDPGHPDADANGYVELPNIDPVSELANMLSARNSFEANLLILRKAREMGDAALRIGR